MNIARMIAMKVLSVFIIALYIVMAIPIYLYGMTVEWLDFTTYSLKVTGFHIWCIWYGKNPDDVNAEKKD